MASQKLELTLPEHVMRRLERRAREAHRSLQDELLILLSAAIPGDEIALPAELESLIESLEVLDDEALTRVAENPLAGEVSRELEALNHAQQRAGLTDSERERQQLLLQQYERVMLTRARAAALLAQRGRSVPRSGPA